MVTWRLVGKKEYVLVRRSVGDRVVGVDLEGAGRAEVVDHGKTHFAQTQEKNSFGWLHFIEDLSHF